MSRKPQSTTAGGRSRRGQVLGGGLSILILYRALSLSRPLALSPSRSFTLYISVNAQARARVATLRHHSEDRVRDSKWAARVDKRAARPLSAVVTHAARPLCRLMQHVRSQRRFALVSPLCTTTLRNPRNRNSMEQEKPSHLQIAPLQGRDAGDDVVSETGATACRRGWGGVARERTILHGSSRGDLGLSEATSTRAGSQLSDSPRPESGFRYKLIKPLKLYRRSSEAGESRNRALAILALRPLSSDYGTDETVKARF